MKSVIHCAAALLLTAGLVAAQPAGLKEASVTMSGKVIKIEYPALPSQGQIAGKPAFFHTDSDLEVQGLAVPKGDYTLFVEPDANEWQLVFSKQPKAQAAKLNPKMVLGRVPMDMKKNAAPAEALKVTLTSFGKVAGKLEVAWGNTIASVPFSLDILKPAPEW
ncbi:MAG TPA: DUF2911 domain-containing protein [Bryobacteraceae bacterium]|nr:DUF2911 domain-containing protein [Bryobacteraceae bacterium]HOQ46981.1 DUF2911 domain-containing protein [Bryobacteraceae bacterium]HPQ16922.1 DUF2911 domain-containing protein [Bryobacteraceae bacterium]HPU73092.1 DUF2911 domain-containing protein [Bryobacteraceae bacterium]